MTNILIFGHKNPDTDTICSSIVYNNLKRIQGMDTEAVRLGEINDETRDEAVKFIEELQKNYTKKIAVEVEAVNNYIDAEEYHQKYLEKNPTGYCHVDLSLAKKSL